MSTPSDFDDITHWPEGSGAFPASWGQGRASFGGAVAATCVRASTALVDPSRTPITLDCSFLGPVVPGELARVEARILRTGKSMTTVEATMIQGDQPCARTLVTYAAPRTSKVHIELPSRAIPPYSGEPVPVVDGMTPIFLQHFELTWAVGAYPYMGVADAVLGGFCKHRTRATGTEALLALIDAWPPPVLPVVKGFATSSSVRWTAHLVAPERFDPTANSFFECRAITANNGYATTFGTLYAESGAPIAWSEQLVAFFER